MKKIMIVLMALSLLVLVGCSGSYDYSVTDDDAIIEGEVEGNEQHVEITTDEGTTEIDVVVENEDSWCMTGTSWTSTSAEADSNMLIEGIVESGEYEGFCHIVMNTETVDATTEIDYYINEDSSEGYYVMSVNGEEYAYSWSG